MSLLNKLKAALFSYSRVNTETGDKKIAEFSIQLGHDNDILLIQDEGGCGDQHFHFDDISELEYFAEKLNETLARMRMQATKFKDEGGLEKILKDILGSIKNK